MHLNWIIHGLTPRTGSSREEHEGEATVPRIGTSEEMGRKAKAERQEDNEPQQGEGGAVRRCTWTG